MPQENSHFLSAQTLIDVHCHQYTDAGHMQILSRDTHELTGNDDSTLNPPTLSGLTSKQNQANLLPATGYFSLGIHPWFIDRQNIDNAFRTLASFQHHPQLLAIGECGLDKCIDTPMPLQIEVFNRQIELAEHLGKPLIIHCVKAFNQLLQIKKARKIESDWIIHGFQAHPDMAAQLVKQGCYLSFGAALLNVRSHAKQALAETAADRIFLETDTAKLPIGAIYAAAAKILGCDIASLRQPILDNFKRVLLHD